MRRIIITILLSAALLAAPGFLMKAQPKTKLTPSQTILLYPEGQKVDRGLAGTLGPQESNDITDSETTDKNGWIRNIGDKARVDLYFPKRGNGQLVVVCPGGGYEFVSSYNEGIYVAEWLVSQGIAAAVVKYRLPNGHSNIPLTDVQNALRYCRANADEWKIKSIGIMGFSAGGHLAAAMGTVSEEKPNALVLGYPVILENFGPPMGKVIPGADRYVTEATPPSFIFANTKFILLRLAKCMAFARELAVLFLFF